MNDTEKWLAKVSMEADGFYQALLSGEQLETDTIEQAAALYARVLIEQRLEEMHCALRSMDDLQKATFGFLTAAAFVMREVKNAAGEARDAEFLHARQSHGAARIGAAPHRRARRRPNGRLSTSKRH